MNTSVLTEVSIYFNKPLNNYKKDFYDILVGKQSAIENPLRTRCMPYQKTVGGIGRFNHFMFSHNNSVSEGISIRFKTDFTDDNIQSLRETIDYVSAHYEALKGIEIVRVQVRKTTVEETEFTL